MSKRALIVAVLAAGALAQAGAAAHVGKPTKSEETTAGPLSVSSIKAVFDPKNLATDYSIDVTDLSKGHRTLILWFLSLQLVDPAGSSPPGNPDSHAAVDATCDNSKLAGGGQQAVAKGAPVMYGWNRGESFTWYHGDKGAYPGSAYGCDHTKMGPSGHQGVVSVFVSSKDGNWSCKVSLPGSNLSPTPEYSAAPVCRSDQVARLEQIVSEVKDDIALERAATANVGKDSSTASSDLDRAGHDLAAEADRLARDGGKASTVKDLKDAAKLDDDARGNLGDNDKKALADLAAAQKLKKKAIGEIEQLIADQPKR